MAPNPSTVPAVKAKLQTMFAAAVETEATEVWRNRPNEDHQLAENVYIGGTRGRREFKTVGRALANQREEAYSVTIDVEVYRQGSDEEGTEARLWTIVAALEQAVAENPTLEPVPNVSWVIVDEFQQETMSSTDGVLAKCTFMVAVTARI